MVIVQRNKLYCIGKLNVIRHICAVLYYNGNKKISNTVVYKLFPSIESTAHKDICF